MAEQENDRLYADRSQESTCADPAVPFLPDVMPDPGILACDTDTPVIETFVDPPLPPTPESPPTELPRPLIVGNREKTQLCPSPSAGTSGVVAVDTYTAEVYVDDAAGFDAHDSARITPFIEDLNLLISLQFYVLDQASFIQAMQAIVLMSGTQCAGIYALLEEAALVVNTVADQLARERATCQVCNTEFWLSCDADNPEGYSVSDAPVWNVVEPHFTHLDEQVFSGEECVQIPADILLLGGTELSDAIADLIAQANSRAEAKHVGTLDCIYHNLADAVAWCSDADAGGYTGLDGLNGMSYVLYDLIHDGMTAGSANRVLVSSYTVGAHTVTGPTPVIAQTRARQKALLELDCFYASTAHNFSCDSLLDGNPVSDSAYQRTVAQGGNPVTPESTNTLIEMHYGMLHEHPSLPVAAINNLYISLGGGVYAQDAASSEALRVVIPAGAFISKVSVTEANVIANRTAASLLTCDWKSPERYISCLRQEKEDDGRQDGGGYPVYVYRTNPWDVPLREGFEDAVADCSSDPLGIIFIPRGQYSMPEFPADSYAAETPWEGQDIDTLSNNPTGFIDTLIKTQMNCQYTCEEVVFCEPVGDNRPKMISGEPNRMFITAGEAAFYDSADEWVSTEGLIGYPDIVDPLTGAVTPAPIGYPENVGPGYVGGSLGTAAVFEFGGVLELGKEWVKYADEVPDPLPYGEQLSDPLRLHFSGARGSATEPDIFVAIENAKADAAGRKVCLHTFWDRTINICNKSTGKGFEAGGTYHFIQTGNTTEEANMAAEEVTTSLLGKCVGDVDSFESQVTARVQGSCMSCPETSGIQEIAIVSGTLSSCKSEALPDDLPQHNFLIVTCSDAVLVGAWTQRDGVGGFIGVQNLKLGALPSDVPGNLASLKAENPDAMVFYISTVCSKMDAEGLKVCATHLYQHGELDLSCETESSTPCSFGKITTWSEGGVAKAGITGGVVACGNLTWNFENYEINLLNDGEWLVYLDCYVEVNMDDDSELLLPGIRTGTKPVNWTLVTLPAEYPEGILPAVPDGYGTIILPIGKLTVNAGVASIVPSGCGGFSVDHCAGTISFSRI